MRVGSFHNDQREMGRRDAGGNAGQCEGAVGDGTTLIMMVLYSGGIK